MAKFTYGGETFDLLTEHDLTFAEGAAACKAAKCKARDLDGDSFESLQALIWVTMKRRNPTLVFADLNDVPLGAFEFIEDDDPPPSPSGLSEVPEMDPTEPPSTELSKISD